MFIGKSKIFSLSLNDDEIVINLNYGDKATLHPYPGSHPTAYCYDEKELSNAI